jgi:aromatic amino acid aminotransferase I
MISAWPVLHISCISQASSVCLQCPDHEFTSRRRRYVDADKVRSSPKFPCVAIPGIPSPEYFPYETLSATIQAVDSLPLNPPRVPKAPKTGLLNWLFPAAKETTSITVPKYATVNPKDPATIQLATSLQYQAATGPPALPRFLREYTEKVYSPAYADWDVLLNVGATDGWAKICGMLLEKGDAILVEEWTYPGAENAFLPLDIEMVALKIDGQGILPEYMEEVLGNWDEEKRGRRRPRVLYTVPTGQNPTGATMMDERKKAVYDVCSKYGKSVS